MCSSMSFKLSFIDLQIKTPTLLLLGADDLRVPPKQGTNFHRLLKAKGVETRLVRIECIGRWWLGPRACFSKVQKLFGSISGATIPVISSQRQGSKPSNFAVLLVFLTLKACLKISYSKQADCGLTTGFSGPKSSRDFRGTGPKCEKKKTNQNDDFPNIRGGFLLRYSVAHE